MNQAHYDLIKSKWGRTSSWSIYDEDYGNYEKNLELIELNVPSLKPHFVFCALNSSFETLRTWETFHVRYPGGKGSILRDVFNNSTVFRGSYMTDLIKDHINPRSGEVVSNIKADQELLLANVSTFLEELADLDVENRRPVIYAIGGAVQTLLSQTGVRDKYEIVPMTHYSAYGKDSGKFGQEIKALEVNL